MSAFAPNAKAHIGMKIKINCKHCKKEFLIRKIDTLNKIYGNFCSRSCMGKFRKGDKNPKWRGGKIKRPDGRICIYIPGHPGANLYNNSYILEYRLIAEKITGRPLNNNEIVHHKNGDVTDNRIENLEVTTQSEHALTHSFERKRRINGTFI